MHIQYTSTSTHYLYVGPKTKSRYRTAASYAPVHSSQFTPILPAARSTAPHQFSTLDRRRSVVSCQSYYTVWRHEGSIKRT